MEPGGARRVGFVQRMGHASTWGGYLADAGRLGSAGVARGPVKTWPRARFFLHVLAAHLEQYVELVVAHLDRTVFVQPLAHWARAAASSGRSKPTASRTR